MKSEIAKEKDEEKKKSTIVAQPAFCMKALVAKKILKRETQSEVGVKKQEPQIKLFDSY